MHLTPVRSGYYKATYYQLHKMVPTIPLLKNVLLPQTAFFLFLCLSLSLSLFSLDARCEELPETVESNEKPALFINLLDKSHSFILNRVNQPATWFDLFFGDPRIESEELASTFVRLRTTAQFIEGEGFKFPVRLRANIKLPRASRKLRLVITGASEDEISTADNQETTSSFEEQSSEQNSVGLRYSLYKTLRSFLHFGAGVSNIIPFEYYFRASFRRFLHIGDKRIIKFTLTGFWDSIDKLGSTSRLDLEKKLSAITTGRISFYGTNDETGTGVEWGVETNLFRRLSDKTALSFDLGTYGETRPHTRITNMRIAQRLRKNILRPWLFLEIEPEVTFPLTEDDDREVVGALSIIFEIQFSPK